jgi:hypothetical protein
MGDYGGEQMTVFWWMVYDVLPIILTIGLTICTIVLVSVKISSWISEEHEKKEILKDGRMTRLKLRETQKTQDFRANLSRKQLEVVTLYTAK